MARILVTGIATIDHVLDVADYPDEDTECRALARVSVPGGNAANTARILAQAGHQTDLAAVVAQDSEGEALLQMLAGVAVGVGCCVREAGHTPVSQVVRSRRSGSRSIVHYRDLPELTARAFRRIALAGYDWFHFEGRNPAELPAMLRAARAAAVDQPLSLELEKPRAGLDAAIPLADVLMFSRDWVRPRAEEPEPFITAMAERHPEQVQTLTWGHRGAWIAYRGAVFHCPPSEDLSIQDSLGAGDSFNAGLVHALVSGEPPQQALASAVRLAERKLSQQGLDGLFD
jgi:ketohexokinase